MRTAASGHKGGVKRAVVSCWLLAACGSAEIGAAGRTDGGPADAIDLADVPPLPDAMASLPDARGPDASQPDARLPDAMPDAGGPPSGLDERPANPTCLAVEPPATPGVALRRANAFPDLPAFSRPLLVRTSSSGDWVYVVERAGRILRFENRVDVDEAEVVIDIRDRVDSNANEEGLLSFVFHPEFDVNGRVFLSYTGTSTLGEPRSLLSEFLSNDGGATFDPGSETTVLDFDKPYDNHNGGHVEFGPDGRLYLATGDGGRGGDPLGNGQNQNTLLGAILRIDVDGEAPYTIPADNPFAVTGGAPEIYAWGLRNPWRFSFDRNTGRLWAGDVGQVMFEEIDIIERGGNYGWNRKEGFVCYRAGCDLNAFDDPVWAYPRADGRSVTGGFVYRGTAIPELVGVYVYADFVSGRFWGLSRDPITAEWSNQFLGALGSGVASFGEDDQGELLLANLNDGRIYRLVRDGDPPEPGAFPQRLSETGCFEPDDPAQPVPGLIPYRPSATLWSDGARKERWAALPDETSATLDDDGDIVFPVGTVLVKAFWAGQPPRRVETRLYMRHSDGNWGGYTYAWNEAQTDADLVDGETRVDVPGGDWLIPSRGQCAQCHTAAAGFSLGLEAAQLQGEITYRTGRSAPQLQTWKAIGLVEGDDDGSRLPAYGSDAPVADRARAYLHVNCSNCHRPDGPGRGDLDLRFSTALADTGVCGAPQGSDLGLDEARVVAAGSLENSVLLERMRRTDVHRMPPLASEVVDDQGVSLVESWIEGLQSCP